MAAMCFFSTPPCVRVRRRRHWPRPGEGERCSKSLNVLPKESYLTKQPEADRVIWLWGDNDIHCNFYYVFLFTCLSAAAVCCWPVDCCCCHLLSCSWTLHWPVMTCGATVSVRWTIMTSKESFYLSPPVRLRRHCTVLYLAVLIIIIIIIIIMSI